MVAALGAETIYRDTGSVARELGCTPEAIAHWEKQGLIPVAPRVGRYRILSPEAVEAIRRVRATRKCGTERRRRS